MESRWSVSEDQGVGPCSRTSVRDGWSESGAGTIDRKIDLVLSYGSLENGWINIRKLVFKVLLETEYL